MNYIIINRIDFFSSYSKDVALNMVSDTYFVPERFADFVK